MLIYFKRMARRTKIRGFLTFNKEWDPSLMFVLGGAVYFYYIENKYIFIKKFNYTLIECLIFSLFSIS